MLCTLGSNAPALSRKTFQTKAGAEQAPEVGVQHRAGSSKKSCRVTAPTCKAFGSTGRRLLALHKIPPPTFLILQGNSDFAPSFL